MERTSRMAVHKGKVSQIRYAGASVRSVVRPPATKTVPGWRRRRTQALREKASEGFIHFIENKKGRPKRPLILPDSSCEEPAINDGVLHGKVIVFIAHRNPATFRMMKASVDRTRPGMAFRRHRSPPRLRLSRLRPFAARFLDSSASGYGSLKNSP